uniref:Methyltransferase FkbM domain-containing protein n=1 Tax=Emiliania huxleyi TaxID=2903 RepID=A0A7S3U195_EMIHU
MLLLAVLLALVNDTSGSRNGRWRKRRLRGSHRAVPDDYSALELDGCGRVFLDGGSNTGESVRAFIKGHFHSCGLRSPSRQYASYWSQLSQAERNAAMQPLKEPASFCVRSFEAAPALLPLLRRQEQDHRAQKYDVRFVEAALGNVTAPDESRRVVRYADNVWGVSASGLRWGDVHVGDKPVARETTSISGQSYDLRGIVARVRSLNASAVVAIKLDIEGSEYWALEPLVADPELLCSVSYLFVEFHSAASAGQRRVAQSYGLREDAFEHLKGRIHAAMERPGCRLKILWRSFWASCGDKQRFEWRSSEQTRDSTSTELPA